MFKKHLIRLLCLIGIVLISVGFISGIGSPTDMIKDSIENYYTKQNVSDFIVKSKTGGFTDEQIAAVKNRYGENNVETGMSIDIQTGEKGRSGCTFSILKIPRSTSRNSSKAKR